MIKALKSYKNNKYTKKSLSILLCAILISATGCTDPSSDSNSVNNESSNNTGNAYTSDYDNEFQKDTIPYIFNDTGYAYSDTDYTVPDGLVTKRDNVTYGSIDDRISYYSSTIGENKECGVLLPATYNTNTQYPVMYILHGNGGDHYDWNRDDSYLVTLCGNMMADGSAVPCIVVMVDMWTAPVSLKNNPTIDTQLDAYDEFYKDLENDLMPFIENHYSVATGREATAIIGTSQGGTEALVAGFKLIDKIGFIGALAPCSGVIPISQLPDGPWNTPVLDSFTIDNPDNTPYYLQLTVGSKDPWCLESTIYYDSALNEKNINHSMTIVDKLGHEDALWQNGIYNFMKRIFKS